VRNVYTKNLKLNNVDLFDNFTATNPLTYSQGNFSLNYDNSLTLDSNNLSVNLSGGNAISYSHNMISVKYDDNSLKLNSSGNLQTNDLYIKNLINSTSPLHSSNGNISIHFGNSLVVSSGNLVVNLSSGNAIDYSSNVVSLRYDNNSLILNEQQVLQTSNVYTKSLFSASAPLYYSTFGNTVLAFDSTLKITNGNLSTSLTQGT
jgi:hypothetical protein